MIEIDGMKAQVREFENQRWGWNEQGVEVFDLMRKKRHQASWREVVRVGGRVIKLQNGMYYMFAIPEMERRLLGGEIPEAFREYNPCAAASAARKAMKQLRWMSLVVIPVFISFFTWVPWVVLHFIILSKGADLPEFNAAFIKGMIVGAFSVLLFPGLYFFKFRTYVADVLRNVEQMELENGCGKAGRGVVPSLQD